MSIPQYGNSIANTSTNNSSFAPSVNSNISTFNEKSRLDGLKRIEQERRKKLDELLADPFIGYEDITDAIKDSKFTSQAEVLARLLNRENLFISGMAGSGKTSIINRFISLIDAEYSGQFNIAVTASTGIAATLIEGATIHSWAGLGISKDPFDKKNVSSFSWRRANEMIDCDVLIIDEISMLPAYLFTKLDETMKFFRKNDEPFGGVQLVLIGDFLQLPPVRRRDDGDLDTRFAIQTESWKNANIKYAYLDKTFRATDPKLKRILQEIAANKVSERTRERINSRINAEQYKDIVYTQLFTTNKNVDVYNEEKLKENPNKLIFCEERVYFGDLKELAKLRKERGINQCINIKEDAIVMITKNINFKDKVIPNGSLGRVLYVYDDVINVKMNDGSVIPIYRIKYNKNKTVKEINPYTKKEMKYQVSTASIEQFPIKLGYAITVHKSQGQTFDGVSMDLSNCFESGLGYVALSRVRDLDDLVITGFNEKAYKVSDISRKVTRFVKKKSMVERKELLENIELYRSLLNDSLTRLMMWNTSTKEERDKN